MVKSPFIWLGAGRAQKRGVARRGALLDKVARAGLPVPEGAILLDELFRIYLRAGVVERAGDKLLVPDPVWLLEVLYRDVRFPRLQTTADLSLIPGDDFSGPLPPLAAVSDVDLEDAGEFAAALSQLYSVPPAQDDIRRDILLVRQVAAQVSGWACVSEGQDGDRVETFTDGEPLSFSMARLGSFQRPSSDLPAHVRRLQMLLRGVRRTLGKGEWAFNWVDDGEICWIAEIC